MNTQTVLRGGALSAIMLLAGCGGAKPPPPVPPTLVNATISATSTVNPGTNGAAAPVVIRVYQLSSPTAFDGAQFFPLFDKDAATLKDDIVKREEFLLAPGQSRTLALTPSDQTRAIGVFAAYRDYEKVSWHVVASVPAHQTTILTVTADKAGLVAKAEAQPVPK